MVEVSGSAGTTVIKTVPASCQAVQWSVDTPLGRETGGPFLSLPFN